MARTTPPGATLDQTSILSLRFPAHKPRRRGGFRAHDDPTESGKVLGTAPVRHWPPPTRAGATGDPKVGPNAAAGVEKWVLPSDRGPLRGHTAGGPPGGAAVGRGAVGSCGRRAAGAAGGGPAQARINKKGRRRIAPPTTISFALAGAAGRDRNRRPGPEPAGAARQGRSRSPGRNHTR